jgi:hypothetical protein
MGKLRKTVKVAEVPGEPLRYQVESWADPRLYHVVDLSENGGNGECDCKDFRTRCTANLKANGGKWVHYGAPGLPNPDRTQCRHCYCARLKFTDTTLRAIAATLHPHPEPT